MHFQANFHLDFIAAERVLLRMLERGIANDSLESSCVDEWCCWDAAREACPGHPCENGAAKVSVFHWGRRFVALDALS